MSEYIEREKAFDAVFGQFCASSDETESAREAALYAKELTEKYERTWGWTQDPPMRRTWEKYLEETI